MGLSTSAQVLIVANKPSPKLILRLIMQLVATLAVVWRQKLPLGFFSEDFHTALEAFEDFGLIA